jgi:hypothetical protein
MYVNPSHYENQIYLWGFLYKECEGCVCLSSSCKRYRNLEPNKIIFNMLGYVIKSLKKHQKKK